MTAGKYILLYDGACVLCNHSVQWILTRDTKDQFRFASQQSSSGKKFFNAYGLSAEGNTVILLTPDGIPYTQSEAVFKVFRIIGGFYKIFLPLQKLPVSLRNNLYQWVARNRYRWFGKRPDACELPPPEIRHKFLN